MPTDKTKTLCQIKQCLADLSKNASDDTIRACKEILAPFDDQNTLDVKYATALVDIASILGKATQPEEAMAVCNIVLQLIENCFDRPQNTDIKKLVALTLLIKGAMLSKLSRSPDEIAVYEEAERRFNRSKEPYLKKAVAIALCNKGHVYERLGDGKKARRTYDKVKKRYGASDPNLKTAVANAVFSTGKSWEQMRDHGKAISAYQEVIDCFSGDDNERLKELVKRAHTSKHVAEIESGQEWMSHITQKLPDFKDCLNYLREFVGTMSQAEYFKRIAAAKERTNQFFTEESLFASKSFFLVLREWNSYTPAIPSEGESDKGGGYFIHHRGEGIVIDPGYDFLSNFHEAGGRLCDIDHIILTHAHDDHTAEFETLLMLLHKFNSERHDKDSSKPLKRVSLYMSAGAQRKFAGLIDLRDNKFHYIVPLYAREGCEQKVKLSDRIALTVLPAYHDDVMTKDMSVGSKLRTGLVSNSYS